MMRANACSSACSLSIKCQAGSILLFPIQLALDAHAATVHSIFLFQSRLVRD